MITFFKKDYLKHYSFEHDSYNYTPIGDLSNRKLVFKIPKIKDLFNKMMLNIRLNDIEIKYLRSQVDEFNKYLKDNDFEDIGEYRYLQNLMTLNRALDVINSMQNRILVRIKAGVTSSDFYIVDNKLSLIDYYTRREFRSTVYPDKVTQYQDTTFYLMSNGDIDKSSLESSFFTKNFEGIKQKSLNVEGDLSDDGVWDQDYSIQKGDQLFIIDNPVDLNVFAIIIVDKIYYGPNTKIDILYLGQGDYFEIKKDNYIYKLSEVSPGVFIDQNAKILYSEISSNTLAIQIDDYILDFNKDEEIILFQQLLREHKFYHQSDYFLINFITNRIRFYRNSYEIITLLDYKYALYREAFRLVNQSIEIDALSLVEHLGINYKDLSEYNTQEYIIINTEPSSFFFIIEGDFNSNFNPSLNFYIHFYDIEELKLDASEQFLGQLSYFLHDNDNNTITLEDLDFNEEFDGYRKNITNVGTFINSVYDEENDISTVEIKLIRNSNNFIQTDRYISYTNQIDIRVIDNAYTQSLVNRVGEVFSIKATNSFGDTDLVFLTLNKHQINNTNISLFFNYLSGTYSEIDINNYLHDKDGEDSVLIQSVLAETTKILNIEKVEDNQKFRNLRVDNNLSDLFLIEVEDDILDQWNYLDFDEDGDEINGNIFYVNQDEKITRFPLGYLKILYFEQIFDEFGNLDSITKNKFVCGTIIPDIDDVTNSKVKNGVLEPLRFIDNSVSLVDDYLSNTNKEIPQNNNDIIIAKEYELDVMETYRDTFEEAQSDIPDQVNFKTDFEPTVFKRILLENLERTIKNNIRIQKSLFESLFNSNDSSYIYLSYLETDDQFLKARKPVFKYSDERQLYDNEINTPYEKKINKVISDLTRKNINYVNDNFSDVLDLKYLDWIDFYQNNNFIIEVEVGDGSIFSIGEELNLRDSLLTSEPVLGIYKVEDINTNTLTLELIDDAQQILDTYYLHKNNDSDYSQVSSVSYPLKTTDRDSNDFDQDTYFSSNDKLDLLMDYLLLDLILKLKDIIDSDSDLTASQKDKLYHQMTFVYQTIKNNILDISINNAETDINKINLIFSINPEHLFNSQALFNQIFSILDDSEIVDYFNSKSLNNKFILTVGSFNSILQEITLSNPINFGNIGITLDITNNDGSVLYAKFRLEEVISTKKIRVSYLEGDPNQLNNTNYVRTSVLNQIESAQFLEIKRRDLITQYYDEQLINDDVYYNYINQYVSNYINYYQEALDPIVSIRSTEDNIFFKTIGGSTDQRYKEIVNISSFNFNTLNTLIYDSLNFDPLDVPDQTEIINYLDSTITILDNAYLYYQNNKNSHNYKNINTTNSGVYHGSLSEMRDYFDAMIVKYGTPGNTDVTYYRPYDVNDVTLYPDIRDNVYDSFVEENTLVFHLQDIKNDFSDFYYKKLIIRLIEDNLNFNNGWNLNNIDINNLIRLYEAEIDEQNIDFDDKKSVEKFISGLNTNLRNKNISFNQNIVYLDNLNVNNNILVTKEEEIEINQVLNYISTLNSSQITIEKNILNLLPGVYDEIFQQLSSENYDFNTFIDDYLITQGFRLFKYCIVTNDEYNSLNNGHLPNTLVYCNSFGKVFPENKFLRRKYHFKENNFLYDPDTQILNRNNYFDSDHLEHLKEIENIKDLFSTNNTFNFSQIETLIDNMGVKFNFRVLIMSMLDLIQDVTILETKLNQCLDRTLTDTEFETISEYLEAVAKNNFSQTIDSNTINQDLNINNRNYNTLKDDKNVISIINRKNKLANQNAKFAWNNPLITSIMDKIEIYTNYKYLDTLWSDQILVLLTNYYLNGKKDILSKMLALNDPLFLGDYQVDSRIKKLFQFNETPKYNKTLHIPLEFFFSNYDSSLISQKGVYLKLYLKPMNQWFQKDFGSNIKNKYINCSLDVDFITLTNQEKLLLSGKSQELQKIENKYAKLGEYIFGRQKIKYDTLSKLDINGDGIEEDIGKLISDYKLFDNVLFISNIKNETKRFTYNMSTLEAKYMNYIKLPIYREYVKYIIFHREDQKNIDQNKIKIKLNGINLAKRNLRFYSGVYDDLEKTGYYIYKFGINKTQGSQKRENLLDDNLSTFNVSQMQISFDVPGTYIFYINHLQFL